MGDEFEMSDLGKLSHYLGIEVGQMRDCIELRQTAYANKLLDKAGLARCNSVKYPMETKVYLNKDENGKLVNAIVYKSLVGGYGTWFTQCQTSRTP